jgi:DNA helicase INO80
MKSIPYEMPKLLYQHQVKRQSHLLHNKLSIHHPTYVHQSRNQDPGYLEVPEDPYAFLRFVNLSPTEYNSIFLSFDHRIDHWDQDRADTKIRQFYSDWHHSNLGLLGSDQDDPIPQPFKFVSRQAPIYGHNNVTIKCMKETLSHRLIRSKKNATGLAKELTHIKKPDSIRPHVLTSLPSFLIGATCPRTIATMREAYAYNSDWIWRRNDHLRWVPKAQKICDPLPSVQGWSNIIMPDKETLVSDAGKLFVLDGLLSRLKSEGHRVLIYSQMTRMIDLLEEFMHHRKHTYIRLDGSSKIHERRDMVNDFQQKTDIFVFLLSTRAGGLGINLTAADTVIFYDSDWNPTVDQQAMDRAHRLGQTKQVTVYRLICKGTIEERILQRAREKSEIQRMVIQGGSFKGVVKPGELKPKEVVSLLLDDEELERKYNSKVDLKPPTNGSSNNQKESWNENIDVESSVDGWISEDTDMFADFESSSVATSRNTTRGPSPINEQQQPLAPGTIVPPIPIPVNVGGRSKRPPSAKRPPKRFDDH